MIRVLAGGVYADLDMEALRNTEPLLGGTQPVLAFLGETWGLRHNIPNAWMASPPGHPFWKVGGLAQIWHLSNRRGQLRRQVRDISKRLDGLASRALFGLFCKVGHCPLSHFVAGGIIGVCSHQHQHILRHPTGPLA